MGTMLQYIEDEPELRARFVNYAFKENPRIRNFSQFVNALKSAFDTDTGRNALSELNDKESIALFESDEAKERIRENVSDKEFAEIYDEVENENVEVLRGVRKGSKTKASDIKVISVKKEIKVKAYSRGENKIRPYGRGYNKWSSAEVRFLRVRKQQKLSPNKIINQYNQHFKEKRSSASIKTRLYRT